MSQVFMIISVYRNFLFHARCGAMDFFDRLSTGTKVSGAFFFAITLTGEACQECYRLKALCF